jgi:hypothetical protein
LDYLIFRFNKVINGIIGWGGFAISLTGNIVYGNPILNETEARTTIAPLEQFVKSLQGNFSFVFAPNYKQFFNSFTHVNVRQLSFSFI